MRNLALGLVLFSCIGLADSYFVEDTTGTGLTPDDAIAVLQFVRTGVTEAGHTVALERTKAVFQLRPKLMRLGRSYIFSLEKRGVIDIKGVGSQEAWYVTGKL